MFSGSNVAVIIDLTYHIQLQIVTMVTFCKLGNSKHCYILFYSFTNVHFVFETYNVHGVHRESYKNNFNFQVHVHPNPGMTYPMSVSQDNIERCLMCHVV